MEAIERATAGGQKRRTSVLRVSGGVQVDEVNGESAHWEGERRTSQGADMQLHPCSNQRHDALSGRRADIHGTSCSGVVKQQ